MNVLELFTKIKVFVFDVDGVMTDGSVTLMDNGLQARTMNVKDGLALQMAQQAGYTVIVISGGSSRPVSDRLSYLGIADVQLGVKDKLGLLAEKKTELLFCWEEVLYMGDDLPDLPLLQRVGLAACPADAAPELKAAAHYVSPFAGGTGCVRDVIEKVLKLHAHWHYQPDVASR